MLPLKLVLHTWIGVSICPEKLGQSQFGGRCSHPGKRDSLFCPDFGEGNYGNANLNVGLNVGVPFFKPIVLIRFIQINESIDNTFIGFIYKVLFILLSVGPA